MQSNDQLPLFPLKLVLFPGGILPLHIFEDRYKLMIGACLSAQRPFGVVLAMGEGIVACGCSARVVSVDRRFKDGRLDISTLGQRRFSVLPAATRKEPYPVADVEFYDDQPEAAAEREVQELKTACLAGYKEAYTATPGNMTDQQLHKATAQEVSFLVAFYGEFSLDEKQVLLEQRSVRERLTQELASLEVARADQKDAQQRSRVIEGNGFFGHNKSDPLR